MKRIFQFLTALVMVFGLSVSAHATLIPIGTATYSLNAGADYNLIYDDDLMITWLDYRHLQTNWQNQVDWAAGLNPAGVLTYNFNPGITMSWTGEWRLPSTVDGPSVWGYDGTTTAGWNITSSEMGHLFYTELGNTGLYDTSGNLTGCSPSWPYCLTKTGDFQKLQPGGYWSGTEYAPNTNNAWGFDTTSGGQLDPGKDGNYYAIAVRPGDVAAVPEPGTLLLLGAGMAGMAVCRKRFGRRHG